MRKLSITEVKKIAREVRACPTDDLAGDYLFGRLGLVDLSEEIKRVRLALGESLDAFGERFGVSRQSVWSWERGTSSPRGAKRDAFDELSATIEGAR